jgi:hypothetical protein
MCARTRIRAGGLVTLPLMNQLSIKEVAFEAAWRYWGLRRELLAVMIVPIAAFLAIRIGSSVLDTRDFVPGTVYVVCYVLVSALAAISCHRVLLLGPVSVPKFGIGHLGRRELSFIGAMLFLGIVGGIVGLFSELLLKEITGIDDWSSGGWYLGLRTIAALPTSYLFARLAMMLPSIAIETHLSVPEAWRLSSGNGWRLVLLIVFLPWVVRQLEWNIAVGIPVNTAASIANTTLYALFLPLEIALLSVSYRHLIK